MTFQGRRFFLDTRVELQQADRAVTGTWMVTTPDNDTRGEITGTLDDIGADTTFTGSVTWDTVPAFGAGRCRGQSGYRGSATSSALRWESARVNWGGTCSDEPQELTWTMRRE
jgi:hypothetical protein